MRDRMKLARRLISYLNWDCATIAPLLAAAILRAVLTAFTWVCTGARVIMQGDTSSYLEPGRNLILRGAFSSNGAPELDRTPGYPIFLMLSGMVGGHVLLTVAAQIAIALCSLLLIRKIATLTFASRGAGLVAAWLYALEPLSITYTVRLLPETLFVFLLLVFIERLLAFHYSGRFLCLASAGLILAAATYVRPVSYYLAPPIAVGLALTQGRRSGHRWKAPCVLLLSSIPWLAAWQLRNAYETGYPGFSSIVEKNLYFYQSAEVSAELRHVPLAEQQAELGYLDEASYLAIHPEQHLWTPAKRLHFMRTSALDVITRHRLLYLQIQGIGVAAVALTPGAAEFQQLLGIYPSRNSMPKRIVEEGLFASIVRVVLSQPLATAIMVLFEAWLLFLYLFAIWGDFFAGGSRFAIATLGGIALYFLLISGGAQAVGRYRLPVMPELCILAAGGIVAVKSSRTRRRASGLSQKFVTLDL